MGISIRTFITVPFLVLTAAPAAIVGWLSYGNSQRTVAAIAGDLVDRAANRIGERVELYLAAPHFLNHLNASAIEAGELPLDDPDRLQGHFYRQLSAAFGDASRSQQPGDAAETDLNRALNHIYVGTEAGTFYGAEYRPRDEGDREGEWIVAVSRADETTDNRLLQYEWTVPEGAGDDAGAGAIAGAIEDSAAVERTLLDRETLADKTPYDPRKRPWYATGRALDSAGGEAPADPRRDSPPETLSPSETLRERERAGWSEVYCDKTTRSPVITAVRPVRFDGEFVGVAGSDFLFSDIQQFSIELLEALEIGETGKIFILDREGYLLVSSDTAVAGCQPDSEIPLTRATELADTAIAAAAARAETTGDREALYRRDGYFWQRQTVGDRDGLGWSLYIAMPEDHFLAEIERNNRLTWALCLLAIAVAIALSLFVSQRIVRPVLQLEQSTRALADAVVEGTNLEGFQIDKNPSELHELARAFEVVSTQLRESFVAFGHFVPASFLSLLGYKSPIEFRVNVCREMEMTILFSDIRSFTRLSESMDPKESFQLVDDYFSAMEPAIHEHGGFIDKFMGDGIMALFHGDRSAERAVAAGLAMLENLRAFNAARRAGKTPLQIGIGIHQGKITIGTLGGEDRWDTTVIGRNVNRASRLEGLTKEFKAALLVSSSTLAALGEAARAGCRCRYLGAAEVRGLDDTMDICEIYSADPPEVARAKDELKPLFDRALAAYQAGSFDRALEGFLAVLAGCPADGAAAFYAARCRKKLAIAEGPTPPGDRG